MKESTQGQILDNILEYCLKNGETDLSDIKKNLLPELNDDSIKHLLEKIDNYKHNIADILFSRYNASISSTGLTQKFLDQGGFDKLENQKNSELERGKELKNLEFKKSKIDLKLAEKMLKEYPKTKWFARSGFIIGLLLGLKELVLWVKSLLSQ
jgi:hypothetical protein